MTDSGMMIDKLKDLRFWLIESHDYDFVPDEYVGLVDEEKGGIVAFGSYDNIQDLVTELNREKP